MPFLFYIHFSATVVDQIMRHEALVSNTYYCCVQCQVQCFLQSACIKSFLFIVNDNVVNMDSFNRCYKVAGNFIPPTTTEKCDSRQILLKINLLILIERSRRDATSNVP